MKLNKVRYWGIICLDHRSFFDFYCNANVATNCEVSIMNFDDKYSCAVLGKVMADRRFEGTFFERIVIALIFKLESGPFHIIMNKIGRNRCKYECFCK